GVRIRLGADRCERTTPIHAPASRAFPDRQAAPSSPPPRPSPDTTGPERGRATLTPADPSAEESVPGRTGCPARPPPLSSRPHRALFVASSARFFASADALTPLLLRATARSSGCGRGS